MLDDQVFDETGASETEVAETENSLFDQASYALGTMQEFVAAIPTQEEVDIPFLFKGTVNPRAILLAGVVIVAGKLFRR